MHYREYRDSVEFDEITMSDPVKFCTSYLKFIKNVSSLTLVNPPLFIMQVMDHQICVCVRKRPRNKKGKYKLKAFT